MQFLASAGDTPRRFLIALVCSLAADAVLVWLLEEVIPPFGSQEGLGMFFFLVMGFRVAHKSRFRARSRDDTAIWSVDLLIHFVPYGLVLLAINVLPVAFSGRLRLVPWIVWLSAAAMIHRHWNLVVSKRLHSGSPFQAAVSPEAERELDEIIWYHRFGRSFSNAPLPIILVGLAGVVAYGISPAARTIMNEYLPLDASVLDGQIWRLATAVIVCRDVFAAGFIIVAATYAGFAAHRLVKWRFWIVILLPPVIANVAIAPLLPFYRPLVHEFPEKLVGMTPLPYGFRPPPLDHLESSLVPCMCLCLVFGFLYSYVTVPTIAKFRVQSQIVMSSLAGAALLLDMTRGGWIALLRDLVALGGSLALTLVLADSSYVGWRLNLLKTFLAKHTSKRERAYLN